METAGVISHAVPMGNDLRIREWRKLSGLTLEKLAESVEMSAPSLSNIERGKQGVTQANLAKIADALGTSIASLYFPPAPGIPVVSYVGAGAEVYDFATEAGGAIEYIKPPAGVPDDAQAAIVRGDSMWPAYFDGFVLVFWDWTAEPFEYIGRPCLVELEDGRRLVKVVRRGTLPGRWNLESFNAPPIEDVKIRRAAPVRITYDKLRWDA